MSPGPSVCADARRRRAAFSLLTVCLTLAALCLAQSLAPPAAVEARRTPAPGDERARLLKSYGELPLRFEANRGQTAGEVKFLARGSRYTLFLTREGAVLRLGGGAATRSTLRLRLEGSRRPAEVVGLDELPGKSNYLFGGDPRGWCTDVPAFGRVRYASVYRGVDVVYYGREGQLEYDFVVSPGADPDLIRLRFEGARAVRVEDGGDLIISTEAGELRQRKPFAYQEVGGVRREVAARYVKDRRGAVRVELGTYDRALPLVIDPVLIYSSYLGGISGEQGLGVAVGPDGAAYVVGASNSADFPGTQPGTKSDFNDAFVAKLSPAGNALVYATYLGGNGDDLANAVAVGSDGAAYVAGLTGSGSFPVTAGAFQSSKDVGLDAFVAKLNPNGSGLVYATYLGGSGADTALSIATDAAGAAHVAGRTDSINFTRFPGPPRAGHPAYRSANGGAAWAPSASGLSVGLVNDLAAAPSAPNTVYAATGSGVYKSTDGGVNWQLAGQVRPSTAPFSTRSVAVDPTNPAIVYAGTAGSFGLYKSTDGGNTFEAKNSGIFIPIVNTIAVDPSAPNTLFAGTPSGFFKTTNGGETWDEVRSPLFGAGTNVNKIVIDPSSPQTVYVATANRGLLKTTDGGANWATAHNGISQLGFTPSLRTIALTPSQPSTLYASSIGFPLGLYKSTDAGANWTLTSLNVTSAGQTFPPTVTALLVDPASPSTVYAGTAGSGVHKSTDAGANWAAANTGLTNTNILALTMAGAAPAVLAGVSVGGDAFAAKLNPAGTQLEYLRLLGGAENEEARGIALAADGSAYVAGTTTSDDFPVANAFQPTRNLGADVFLTKLNPAGATTFSTYLGGFANDQAFGVAVGPDGSAHVAGTTFSDDFPVGNGVQMNHGGSSDAFVTKFAPDGQSLTYSTFLGGGFTEQGLGVAVGPDGAAYVVGMTNSDNFPSVNPASPPGGFNDAFLAKLNPNGSALVHSTYFGGSGSEQANGVAVDSAGAAYLVGSTNSTNLPVISAVRPNNGGGSDAFVAKIGPGVELAVSITDAPDPVLWGTDLTYTIGVRNNGELPATGVVLTDALPNGSTFVSASTTRGSCTGTATVVCQLGTLGGGETATVIVTIKPPAAKTITNTASVTLNENDPVVANNSASATTSVNFADLSLAKKAPQSLAAPGSRLTYFLTVRNKDGVAATSVSVTDTLPPATTLVNCTANGGGVCTSAGNVVTVTFPSLAVGATQSAVITATLSGSAAEGAVVSNQASVSSAMPDPAPGDNAATADVTVAAQPIRPKANGLVVFSSDRAFTNSTQPTGVYTVKPDGTGETFLPSLPPFFSNPTWSPDGTKLAYDDGQQLKIANADGTGAITVANNVSDFNRRISWSPNGAQLAYIGNGPGFDVAVLRTIQIANADGSGFSMLPNSPNILEAADWSPDGSKFIYTDGSALFVTNVDGSDRRQLTFPPVGSDGPTFDVAPRWSPDGTRVLFERRSNNFNDVFLMNADGTGASKLLNIFRTRTPAWSPDGSKLVFESLNELYTINLDGTGQTALTQNHFFNFTPDWQPLPGASPTPTPTPSQTFNISGRLTPAPGQQGQPFGQVRLTGTRTAEVAVGPGGDFTFVRLPAGGDYTLTATSDFFAFTPASREYRNLSADVTDADFAGTFVPADITGHIRDSQGNPLAGIRVTSAGGFPEGTTFTDQNGFYSFPNVQRLRTYFISPDPFTPYTFAPASQTIFDLRTSTVVNFVGTRQPSHVIRGRVVEAGPNGPGIAGVQINLARNNTAVTHTFTDSAGNFSFGERQDGHQYAVSIFPHPTYIFDPKVDAPNPFGQIVIPSLTADADLTFFGTRHNTVQFTSASASVGEADGQAVLTVTRTGETSLPATVNYETADGTANARSDYTAAFGTLRFAAHETSKTITLFITDDAHVEGAQSFSLRLDVTNGTRLGETSFANITIADNDASPTNINPSDNPAFFVTMHYRDFLGRDPDADGLAHWVGQTTNCGNPDPQVCRINVSGAFFLSIEFQETGYLAYRAYKAAYGDATSPNVEGTVPIIRLREFLADAGRIGQGVQVGVGDWFNQLEANKAAYVLEFVQRTRFIADYPASMTAEQFVERLDTRAGGVLSPEERAELIGILGATPSDAQKRSQVLRRVAEDSDLRQRETNRAFVLMQYYGYMRRNPDDPQDADFRGWRFWLDKLEEHNGNFVNAEMVRSFIESIEYRQRFGQ